MLQATAPDWSGCGKWQSFALSVPVAGDWLGTRSAGRLLHGLPRCNDALPEDAGL